MHSDRTITTVNVQSQEAYDLLKHFHSKPRIHDFLLKALEAVYLPLLDETEKLEQEFEAKLKHLEEEREAALQALTERKARMIPNAEQIVKDLNTKSN